MASRACHPAADTKRVVFGHPRESAAGDTGRLLAGETAALVSHVDWAAGLTTRVRAAPNPPEQPDAHQGSDHAVVQYFGHNADQEVDS